MFSSISSINFPSSADVNSSDFCVYTNGSMNGTCESWSYGDVTDTPDLTLVRDFDLVCEKDTITMLINTLYVAGKTTLSWLINTLHVAGKTALSWLINALHVVGRKRHRLCSSTHSM